VQPPLSISISKEAIEAYEENEAREYFADRTELMEKEAIIAQILNGLRQQQIWCIAKDYNIDTFLDAHDINKRLTYVNTDDVRRRLHISDEIDPTQYPVSAAQDNYMAFLYDELCRERKLIRHCYFDQNYLGRILVYCIDKLIQGCGASFELIKTERNRNT
jgi:hypothetical protein